MAIDFSILIPLGKAFPRAVINVQGDFIACSSVPCASFNLMKCQTKKDVQAKVLEWFSRDAYKTLPCNTEKKNREYHEYISRGINHFLGVYFTEADFEKIYTYIGNGVNHEKTLRFIDGGYDLNILEEKNATD